MVCVAKRSMLYLDNQKEFQIHIQQNEEYRKKKSNCFILVKVMMALKPVPGILHARYGQFIIANPPTDTFLVERRTPERPNTKHAQRILKTSQNGSWSTGLNA